MIKNNKSKITIIFLILIIICIVIIILLNNMIDKKAQEQYFANIEEKQQIGRFLSLSGVGIFFEQYDGDLKTSEISKKLEEVNIKYLPEMYEKVKNLDDSSLEEYFDDHTFNLEKHYGIEEFTDFKHLIDGIKETGIDIQQWNSLSVLRDTFKNDSDKSNYAYAEYEVTYDNEQTIRYSVYIAKSNTQSILYRINIVD